MRALVVALLVVSGTARAEMVALRRQVPLVEKCGSPASWDRVMACFERLYQESAKVGKRMNPEAHVKTALVTSTAHGRVIRVTSNIDGETLLVLRELETGWQLIGILPGVDDVESIEAATISGKRGFRIVRHQSGEATVDLGGGMFTTGTIRQTIEQFCDGRGTYCDGVVTACDVLVNGKAYQTFRGTLTYEGGSLHAEGDRSAAGICG